MRGSGWFWVVSLIQRQCSRANTNSTAPAKNLVSVKLNIATLESDNVDATALWDLAIEQRRFFSSDDVDGAKAVKALG